MSKTVARAVAAIAKTLVYALPHKRPGLTRAQLVEALEDIRTVRSGDVCFKMSCRSKWTAALADSFSRFELDTKAWIDGLPDGSVIWDIGAHVGAISLYAAKKGHRVFAFEPHADNYSVLCRNLHLNELSGVVTAYGIGLGTKTELNVLKLSGQEAGSAMNTVGQAKSQFGEIEMALDQGVVVVTGDDLLQQFGLPQPYAIKLDVDGNEPEVLRGASQVLRGASTLLIEIEGDNKGARDVLQPIEEAGLVDRTSPETVSRNRIFERA